MKIFEILKTNELIKPFAQRKLGQVVDKWFCVVIIKNRQNKRLSERRRKHHCKYARLLKLNIYCALVVRQIATKYYKIQEYQHCFKVQYGLHTATTIAIPIFSK